MTQPTVSKHWRKPSLGGI